VPGALAPPPAVYWVQVGAFLDHKNADRLVEKLKGDGLAAATTSFEQSRVLYRVLLVSGDGGRVSDDAIERVKGLGHPVEATSDGPAVTGLVPLRKAVETSHSLRQQGVPVQLVDLPRRAGGVVRDAGRGRRGPRPADREGRRGRRGAGAALSVIGESVTARGGE
jgi:hypothetical protein